jgi:hypothetical protein
VNWTAITDGILDELAKIAEIDVSAIEPETLEASQPQPMPSAAYEKAQHILQLADQYKPKTAAKNPYADYLPTGKFLPKGWKPPKSHQEFLDRLGIAARRGKALAEKPGTQLPLPGLEKKSYRMGRSIQQPDVLPQLRSLLDEKKQEEKKSRYGSAAGHVLGGAGAAKFTHDWADAGRQARAPKTVTEKKFFGLFKKTRTIPHAPTNMKHRFIAMSAGGALGAGIYAGKKIKQHQEAKKAKTSAVVKPLNSQAVRIGLRGRAPDPFK